MVALLLRPPRNAPYMQRMIIFRSYFSIVVHYNVGVCRYGEVAAGHVYTSINATLL